MKYAHRVIVGALFAASVVPIWAQSMPPRYMPDAVGLLSVRGPAHVAETAAVPMLKIAAVTEASPEAIDEMRQWNAAGRQPTKTGIYRTLLKPYSLTIATRGDRTVTAGAVQVQGAARLRLHLKRFPVVGAMWVWGTDGRLISFGSEACDANGCWTPTVFSDTIYFEAEGAFSDGMVDGIVEGFASSQVQEFASHAEAVPSCFIDATCISSSTLDVIAEYRGAVAHIEFADSTGSYQCSAALINNGTTSPLPILLTAHHCISTSSAAASLQAFWDYRSSTCGGTAPSLATLPRSIGSSLVATSSLNDFTLLRLNALPPGRWFLGWDTATLATGTRIYRISHPADAITTFPYPQTYSSTIVSGATIGCQATQRPHFMASTLSGGSVAGGSSGGPTITAGGYIVGQLLGNCAAANTDVCSSNQLILDGAFRDTYDAASSILDPSPQVQCSACVPDARTACALGGRFKMTLRWHDNVSGSSGTGALVKYAENTPETNPTYGILSEMVYFSFYPDFPKSVEVVAKMVKGVGINDKFWAFATSVNNSEYWVDIVDTQSCRTWTGHQPFGQLTTIADFSAFPFP